jgi:hypothetical protein
VFFVYCFCDVLILFPRNFNVVFMVLP